MRLTYIFIFNLFFIVSLWGAAKEASELSHKEETNKDGNGMVKKRRCKRARKNHIGIRNDKKFFNALVNGDSERVYDYLQMGRDCLIFKNQYFEEELKRLIQNKSRSRFVRIARGHAKFDPPLHRFLTFQHVLSQEGMRIDFTRHSFAKIQQTASIDSIYRWLLHSASFDLRLQDKGKDISPHEIILEFQYVIMNKRTKKYELHWMEGSCVINQPLLDYIKKFPCILTLQNLARNVIRKHAPKIKQLRNDANQLPAIVFQYTEEVKEDLQYWPEGYVPLQLPYGYESTGVTCD